jgi:hypothetical protein
MYVYMAHIEAQSMIIDNDMFECVTVKSHPDPAFSRVFG